MAEIANGRMAGWQNTVRRGMRSKDGFAFLISFQCLLRFVGMSGASRADALHYIREGIRTKQRRHRNETWKALEQIEGIFFTILTQLFVKIFGGFNKYSYFCNAIEKRCECQS